MWHTLTPIRARSRRGSPWPSSSRAWGQDTGRRSPMPEPGMLQEFLDGGQVGAAVFALRPDYRALLLAVDGLVPGPSDHAGDALLQKAETAARKALHEQKVEQLPHVA